MDENTQDFLEVEQAAVEAAESTQVTTDIVETVAEETTQVVEVTTKVEVVEPTELKCNECGETLPVSAFYRVTKGGKFRQPCRNCYDMRYYGRKHGERKAKVAKPAGEVASTDAAVAAVVETLPEEAVIETPEAVAPVVEEPKKKGRKGKKQAEQAPAEVQAEVVEIELPSVEITDPDILAIVAEETSAE